MVCRGWLLACLPALVARSSAWEFASPSELESSLREHGTVVVAFVAPSEDKSKSLEPEWVRAAPAAKVPFLSVDCTSSTSIGEQCEVASYPSVKLLQGGAAVSTYEGPRRASAITAWAERTQRPTLSPIDAESLKSFKTTDETVFIAYLSPDDESSRSAFQEAASKYAQEFTFGISTDVASIDAEGLEVPAVKCYKPLDGDTQLLRGAFSSESLDSFVKEASRPVIGELLPHNHQRFLDRGWPTVYVFALTEAERTELRLTLRKMARSYYESLTMVTVDPYEFPELPAKLGLEPGVFPAGAVHQLSNDRIYPYPKGQPITPSALQQWGLDVWQGRVKAWTPPGATPVADQDTPGRIKATRKVSVGSFPGVKIKIGRDEL
ncbi:thioredoxin-like domain-containing protein [Xylariales sp. AK1849]|nr:thioredoxin-like domain-containing protein [Xylariales sp. AK1849]